MVILQKSIISKVDIIELQTNKLKWSVVVFPNCCNFLLVAIVVVALIVIVCSCLSSLLLLPFSTAVLRSSFVYKFSDLTHLHGISEWKINILCKYLFRNYQDIYIFLLEWTKINKSYSRKKGDKKVTRSVVLVLVDKEARKE